jgi:hypothetical protein
MAIFLHIGLNKTGSSSIQKFCELHREVLRSHGVEYPEAGIFDSAHYGLSKLLIGKPAVDHVPVPEGLEEAIASALARDMHVVLSSEYLGIANKREVLAVKQFLARFGIEVKIVVYLRRHDLWMASLFNQAVKTAQTYQPWLADIRDYILQCIGDPHVELRYSRILDRWADEFAVANVVVRPFEAAQFRGGELLWDFLAIVREDLPELLQKAGTKPIRVNESVPEHLLRAIATVRALNMDAEAKQRIVAILLNARAPAGPDGQAGANPWDSRAFTMPLHLRRAVVNMFAADYRQIGRRYLGREDGILFREPIASHAVPGKERGAHK